MSVGGLTFIAQDNVLRSGGLTTASATITNVRAGDTILVMMAGGAPCTFVLPGFDMEPRVDLPSTSCQFAHLVTEDWGNVSIVVTSNCAALWGFTWHHLRDAVFDWGSFQQMSSAATSELVLPEVALEPGQVYYSMGLSNGATIISNDPFPGGGYPLGPSLSGGGGQAAIDTWTAVPKAAGLAADAPRPFSRRWFLQEVATAKMWAWVVLADGTIPTIGSLAVPALPPKAGQVFAVQEWQEGPAVVGHRQFLVGWREGEGPFFYRWLHDFPGLFPNWNDELEDYSGAFSGQPLQGRADDPRIWVPYFRYRTVNGNDDGPELDELLYIESGKNPLAPKRYLDGWLYKEDVAPFRFDVERWALRRPSPGLPVVDQMLDDDDATMETSVGHWRPTISTAVVDLQTPIVRVSSPTPLVGSGVLKVTKHPEGPNLLAVNQSTFEGGSAAGWRNRDSSPDVHAGTPQGVTTPGFSGAYAMLAHVASTTTFIAEPYNAEPFDPATGVQYVARAKLRVATPGQFAMVLLRMYFWNSSGVLQIASQPDPTFHMVTDTAWMEAQVDGPGGLAPDNIAYVSIAIEHWGSWWPDLLVDDVELRRTPGPVGGVSVGLGSTGELVSDGFYPAEPGVTYRVEADVRLDEDNVTPIQRGGVTLQEVVSRDVHGNSVDGYASGGAIFFTDAEVYVGKNGDVNSQWDAWVHFHLSDNWQNRIIDSAALFLNCEKGAGSEQNEIRVYGDTSGSAHAALPTDELDLRGRPLTTAWAAWGQTPPASFAYQSVDVTDIIAELVEAKSGIGPSGLGAVQFILTGGLMNGDVSNAAGNYFKFKAVPSSGTFDSIGPRLVINYHEEGGLNRSATISLVYRDASGNWLGVENGDEVDVGTGAWVRPFAEEKAPDGAASVGIEVSVSAGPGWEGLQAGDSIFVSNAVLKPVGDGPFGSDHLLVSFDNDEELWEFDLSADLDASTPENQIGLHHHHIPDGGALLNWVLLADNKTVVFARYDFALSAYAVLSYDLDARGLHPSSGDATTLAGVGEPTLMALPDGNVLAVRAEPRFATLNPVSYQMTVETWLLGPRGHVLKHALQTGRISTAVPPPPGDSANEYGVDVLGIDYTGEWFWISRLTYHDDPPGIGYAGLLTEYFRLPANPDLLSSGVEVGDDIDLVHIGNSGGFGRTNTGFPNFSTITVSFSLSDSTFVRDNPGVAPAEGDLIILVFNIGSNSGNNVSITGTGWHRILEQAATPSRVIVYVKEVKAGETAMTWTATYLAPNNQEQPRLVLLRGVTEDDLKASVATINNGQYTVRVPSLDGADPGDYLVTIASGRGAVADGFGEYEPAQDAVFDSVSASDFRATYVTMRQLTEVDDSVGPTGVTTTRRANHVSGGEHFGAHLLFAGRQAQFTPEFVIDDPYVDGSHPEATSVRNDIRYVSSVYTTPALILLDRCPPRGDVQVGETRTRVVTSTIQGVVRATRPAETIRGSARERCQDCGPAAVRESRITKLFRRRR